MSELNKKLLRKYIIKEIYNYMKEQKLLEEKDAEVKPTSGLKKLPDSDVHTKKTKSKNPPSKKITPDGPENKTLADAEPTKVDNEVKTMKQKDESKKTENSFETTCLGVSLKVKGRSFADINHLYLIGQIKKALEGKGEYVNKVTIEMGEQPINKKELKTESITESKVVRDKVIKDRVIKDVKKQIKKGMKLAETGEMSNSDIQKGGEYYSWANSIEKDVKHISKLTNGKLKFILMKPFDVYLGPYAYVRIDDKLYKIWSVGDISKVLYIEGLDWTGSPKELAAAINGDKKMIEKVKKQTDLYRNAK